MIEYDLPRRSYTTLSVYNILGQTVAILVDGYQSPGGHTIKFDSKNLPGGIYFYRLQAGAFAETKKLLLVR